jgi:hypothetical protein
MGIRLRRHLWQAHNLELALEAHPLNGMIPATQSDHVVAEGAQEFQAGLGIGVVAELAPGQSILGGNIGGKMVGDGAVAGLGELAGLGEETVGFGEGGLLEEPLAVGTLFPLGEVVFADGPPGAGGGEGLLDFGAGIEPGEDLCARLAVAQTETYLLANWVREAGDFTFWCLVHRLYLVVLGCTYLYLVVLGWDWVEGT